MLYESVLIVGVSVVYFVNATSKNNEEIWKELLEKVLPIVILYNLYSMGMFGLSWYRIKTAAAGLKRLFYLPKKEKLECIAAYEFFEKMQTGEPTSTEEETMHVRNYYNVLNEIMAIVDIEKMYIPPLLNEWEGLYVNQTLVEEFVYSELKLKNPPASHLLDMGCGRGRISYHFQKLSGGKISGYNIDGNQIQSAKEFAKQEGLANKMDFKIGDHHKRLDYSDNSFDGAYSFQAVWPFLKKDELDFTCKEMFRVMKPGARYACSEYLLTPHFDWNNPEHVALHRVFLPTLAATQSMYPADVCAAMERAGFKIIVSAPSKSEAWPLCEQKRDIVYAIRRVIHVLTPLRLCPKWLAPLMDNLQKGGQAWTDAEKMKIADLNWRIVCEKP